MILPKPTCEKHVHKHHNFFTPQSPYKDTMVSLSRHHGLFVKTPWSLCQDTMVSLSEHHGLFVRTPWSLCQNTTVSLPGRHDLFARTPRSLCKTVPSFWKLVPLVTPTPALKKHYAASKFFFQRYGIPFNTTMPIGLSSGNKYKSKSRPLLCGRLLFFKLKITLLLLCSC